VSTDQRTRIAFVITELDVGGAERCLANLASRINRQRFEPLVISLASRPAAGKDALVVQLERAQVPVRFLNRRSAWEIQSGFAALARMLEEFRPHIAQTLLFHANVLGAAAARRAGVPHVLAGIRVADPRRWRAWMERWACRHVDQFVCVSAGVAQHCRQRGYPPSKLTVIPNGVDWESFASARPIDPRELGLPAGRRAIVFVGRLDIQKGLDELLAICPQLMTAAPDHDLVLVGDGPERSALARQAESLGIAPRVYFAGWRADVPAILAAAEMLVLPSRWEGMPNVVLEAMAAGKPVVVRRVEGTEELLGDLGREQIVDAGPKELLADRVIHFAQNPQLAADLGRKNQQRAIQLFSIETMVEKYERLYDSLVAV
jgi:glycosyltransferase involved in cell wall biosynthesis